MLQFWSAGVSDDIGAAREGDSGDQSPPFESTQFHKNYLKKKFQKPN